MPAEVALRLESVSVAPRSGDTLSPSSASQAKKSSRFFPPKPRSKNRSSNADVEHESYFALSSMDGRHLVRLGGRERGVFSFDCYKHAHPKKLFSSIARLARIKKRQ